MNVFLPLMGRLIRCGLSVTILLGCQAKSPGGELRGQIADAASGEPVQARLYIQHENGRFFFGESDSEQGRAVVYNKRHGQNSKSVEQHTSLTAHPFRAELPRGRYTLTVERGPEYLPATATVDVTGELEASVAPVELKLQRWIDMGARGWFSGDTHVHRSLEDLPVAMLAEDLNVALPLVYWVTQGFQPPSRGDKTTAQEQADALIRVDATHVIYPRNTEYEIFTVHGRRHTLGAVFVLNHRDVLELGAPPVTEIARAAHAQGALLDLDKHNWPWSMVLVPVMGIDLYELSNNHVWRTEFAFTDWGESHAPYMGLPLRSRYGPERDWVEFGWQNYYALLNCGFRLRPTAGTASGVHPVPLGFSRVYVHLPDGFSYDTWIEGLGAGRSFVTTGPMLEVAVNSELPGHVFAKQTAVPFSVEVTGTASSQETLESIEVLWNGQVAAVVEPKNQTADAGQGGYRSPIAVTFTREQSGWVAVRCLESRSENRFRFAHSGPVYFEVPGRPLRPRREEVEYLLKRVEDELARSSDVLPEAALEEYRQAREVYRKLRDE